MTVTITKVNGPFYQQGRGTGYELSLLLDTVFATGGENVDLTPYLSTLTSGDAVGVDAIADATWRFDVVGPGTTTTLTATNVKLVAHHGSGSDGVDNPADAEDTSGVAALVLLVWGKKALVTSWA